MKNLIAVLGISLALLMTSCGGDDDCTIDDWVGTWTGNLDCDEDDLDEVATIRVTKKDENTLLFDDGSDVFEFPFSGCDFSSTQNLDDVNFDFKASLNGDNMDWEFGLEFMGISVDCSATLSR